MGFIDAPARFIARRSDVITNSGAPRADSGCLLDAAAPAKGEKALYGRAKNRIR